MSRWIKRVIKFVTREWWSFWPPSPPPLAQLLQSQSTHSSSLSSNGNVCLSPSSLASLCLALSFSFTHLTFSPSYQSGSEAWESCLQLRQQQGRAEQWNAGNWDLRVYRVTAFRAFDSYKREYVDLRPKDGCYKLSTIWERYKRNSTLFPYWGPKSIWWYKINKPVWIHK